MTVTKKCVEMTLFLLLILLVFLVSSNNQQLSNCEFNLSFKGQSVVYNFGRLSRQESWQTTNGAEKAFISVCEPFLTPLQYQHSVLVSGQQNKTWRVVVSNAGAYQISAHSVLERPVLDLVGTQPCSGGMNYSTEISFVCSSVDQNPVLISVRENCTLLVMWETVAACPFDKDCVFGDSDFSSLRHSDYYEVETTARQKFLLNICGPVRSGACSDNDLVTACKVDEHNKTVIGHLDGHHVELSKTTGLALIYTTVEKGPRTEIQFVCNASASFANLKFLKKLGETYIFEVETPLACKAWPYECMVLDNNDGHIDLSPLRKESSNWVIQPSSGVQYHINVCGPLNPMLINMCADGVGACRTDSNSSISLGFMTRGLRVTESNTVILEYTGGSSCPSGGMHSMQIEFSCSKVVGMPVFVRETAKCVHHFSWETMASCPSLLAVGENCVVQEKQYGGIFNLMELHSPHGGYSLTTEQGDNYLINVCGPLNRTCSGQEASVCLITQAGNMFAIGRVNKTVIYDSGALRFVLYGEGCKPGRNVSTVMFLLLCRHGSDVGQPEFFSKDDDCNFYFVWNTRAACPPHQFVDCTLMHNEQFYDLSQLTDLMSNHVVVKSGLMFLLNVCHSIVFGKDAFCQYSSAACLFNLSNPDPTSRFSNIGDVGNGPYFEDGRIKLRYDGGEICRDPEGPDHISTIITFECDHSTNYMPELLIGDVCMYEFMWRTQAACPVNATTEQPHEDDSCTVVVPGTDNRINLRPLRNKVRMVADLAGYNYSFVVCGNLSGSPCGNNGVGVCKFKAQDQSQFWNAGVGNSHLHYSQGAISLKYTDGAPCNDKLKRSTQIVFVCEPSGSERIVFIDKVESCTYIINWYTDLACNGLQVECSTPAWSDPEPVNLTPLIRLDHNYKVQAQNDTVFYINVCHPLLPVQGLNCPGGSSACVARLHNGNLIEEKSLGFASGPVKGDKGKVFIMYLQGSECDSGPDYSSKIDFECDPKSGQGEPVFRNLTSDCQYQFLWKTSVTCPPFTKFMSVSEGQCILNNEQMNARMDLKKLGQHGVMQVQDYSMNLCSLRTITHITNNKSYGTLTSVEFDYQQKQVRLLFSMGANCTVTERYKSQLLLNCDEDAGSREPRVLMENDCGVVIEWLNANVCDVLVPSSVHTTLRSESTSGSSVGLVVGLIILAAVLCLLVLHFRKPANRSQLRSWVYSFLGMRRHNGQFHYSLENDGVWSEL